MLKNRQAVMSIVKAIILCGRQNLALRGKREGSAGQLEEEAGNDGNFCALLRLMIESGDKNLSFHLSGPKNATYTSPLIQNEIISVIGKFIQEKIVEDVKKNGGIYSVLADEMQDIGGVEQLSVCVRYVKYLDNKSISVREDFLCFKDLYKETFEIDFSSIADDLDAIIEPKLTGEKIGEAISNCLHALDLGINECVGQGYDGASVMSSEVKGACSVILGLNPRALYLHCAAHSLNLVIVDACKQQSVRNMISTTKQVINFINVSAKRKEVFQAVVKYFHPDRRSVHLISLCETRWVERHVALENFIELLDAVSTTLNQVKYKLF